MPFVLSIFIFAVFTVIHLVCCYLGLERARMVTKCMLIPLLTISLQAYGCNKVLIYCALIFGLIGDLLIVVNNDKMFFMLGMLSFGVNHIFNLITVISLIPFELNYFYYIGMAVLAVCYIGLFGYFLKGYMGKISYVNGVYSYIILLNIIFSVILMISLYGAVGLNAFLGGIAVLLGVIIFSISDTLIAINVYVRTLKKSSFFTMGTYILAQILISFGLAFIIKLL